MRNNTVPRRRRPLLLGVRISPRERGLLDEAIACTDESLSEFVRRIVLPAARRVVKNAEAGTT
jgi:uncharacterized protein (DUF1778 family)